MGNSLDEKTLDKPDRKTYYQIILPFVISVSFVLLHCLFLSSNLHSPERRLIELRIEHADLDALIDRVAQAMPLDELMIRRLKKKRLGLRDEVIRIERMLTPNEPA